MGQVCSVSDCQAVTHGLVLSNDQLREVTNRLKQQFSLGLQGEKSSDVKMLVTHVKSLPTGQERGQYLALDLGGTNFRTLLVTLDPGHQKENNPHQQQHNGHSDHHQKSWPGKQSKPHVIQESHQIPERLLDARGDVLFDHIARCLVKFLKGQGLPPGHYPLGFTFSFPCEKRSLAQSRLVKWTKGFKCPGVVGHDVAQMLKGAVRRQQGGYSIDLLAVINDTTGTLVSTHHQDPDTMASLIVGTGCNACYVEDIKTVSKLKPGHSLDGHPGASNTIKHQPQQIVINTEWGAFGDNGCLEFVRTKWDRELDTLRTANPGRQQFEKMISGNYLGELARLILLDLTQRHMALAGRMHGKITDKDSIDTATLFEWAAEDFNKLRQVLMDKFEIVHVKECHTCIQIVKAVSQYVVHRSADLVAAGCVAILEHINRQSDDEGKGDRSSRRNVIAYDGAVITKGSGFIDRVRQRLEELNHDGYQVDFVKSEDGSGLGSAILAAVVTESEVREKTNLIGKDGKMHTPRINVRSIPAATGGGKKQHDGYDKKDHHQEEEEKEQQADGHESGTVKQLPILVTTPHSRPTLTDNQTRIRINQKIKTVSLGGDNERRIRLMVRSEVIKGPE